MAKQTFSVRRAQDPVLAEALRNMWMTVNVGMPRSRVACGAARPVGRVGSWTQPRTVARDRAPASATRRVTVMLQGSSGGAAMMRSSRRAAKGNSQPGMPSSRRNAGASTAFVATAPSLNAVARPPQSVNTPPASSTET